MKKIFIGSVTMAVLTLSAPAQELRDVRELGNALGMTDPIIAKAPNELEIALKKRRAALKKAELAWQAVETGIWRGMMK